VVEREGRANPTNEANARARLWELSQGLIVAKEPTRPFERVREFLRQAEATMRARHDEPDSQSLAAGLLDAVGSASAIRDWLLANGFVPGVATPSVSDSSGAFQSLADEWANKWLVDLGTTESEAFFRSIVFFLEELDRCCAKRLAGNASEALLTRVARGLGTGGETAPSVAAEPQPPQHRNGPTRAGSSGSDFARPASRDRDDVSKSAQSQAAKLGKVARTLESVEERIATFEGRLSDIQSALTRLQGTATDAAVRATRTHQRLEEQGVDVAAIRAMSADDREKLAAISLVVTRLDAELTRRVDIDSLGRVEEVRIMLAEFVRAELLRDIGGAVSTALDELLRMDEHGPKARRLLDHVERELSKRGIRTRHA
jgi:hypothetical protein